MLSVHHSFPNSEDSQLLAWISLTVKVFLQLVKACHCTSCVQGENTTSTWVILSNHRKCVQWLLCQEKSSLCFPVSSLLYWADEHNWSERNWLGWRPVSVFNRHLFVQLGKYGVECTRKKEPAISNTCSWRICWLLGTCCVLDATWAEEGKEWKRLR